jgi:hypothetical protein
MAHAGGPRFYRLICFILALLVVFSLWYKDAALGTFRDAMGQQLCSAPLKLEQAEISSPPYQGSPPPSPLVRKNIALATSFDYHQDVLFALAWTLERVMKGDAKLNVYVPPKLSWNIEGVVRELGLYHGEMKSKDDLIRDIVDNPGDGGIDMVILGTCEIECVVRSSLLSLPGHGLMTCFPM